MISRLLNRLRPPAPKPGPPAVPGLYVSKAPHPQNAVDIFKGEWSSTLPPRAGAVSGGGADLFDDARITWFAEIAGGVKGKTVLELGPLEGGHSAMLEALGADSIVAIEANTRAYLRCLLVQDLLGLRRVRFLCGDFVEYLRSGPAKVQIGLASGVLYHQQHPAELLDLLAQSCTERIFVWTHYYDRDLLVNNRSVADSFVASTASEYRGFRHTLHRQEYRVGQGERAFCGAGTTGSAWMEKEDILRCLEHFGFRLESVGFEHPHHPNGPAFALSATRRTT